LPLAAEVVAGEEFDVAGEHGQRRADLDLACEDQRRAHVGGDHGGHLVRPFLQQLPGGVEPLRAFRHRRRGSAAERFPCRANRVVDIGWMTGSCPRLRCPPCTGYTHSAGTAPTAPFSYLV